ncbi:lantibiotic dehydratase family protein [Epilithonimonas hominis]|uniref:Lantibiotic dehydratase n=1 Tax=Epilithonimonas hominis TaxID=420404 RepID=A0A3N0XAY4_9FLAO|nr:lantibiotic dehydratase family protein [Epilithonimonas hominis]ROI14526.1 lantibiotic dehydratase [Epilithonimonas hominis]
MARFPYTFFDNFIVRTPLFSVLELKKIFSDNTDTGALQKNFEEKVFKEAIYLASPILYEEIEKSNSKAKLNNALLKYFIRMSTRSTPFGLFSGVGLAKFDEQSLLFSNGQKLRDTKADMHFLFSLSNHLLSLPHIRNEVLFFPNNSIYRIGKKIRYVEFESNNGKRNYVLSSAIFSDELEQILIKSESGKTIKELARTLITEDISESEAVDYVNELITNQILVSELEPTVSGIDFLDSIISILNRINAFKERDFLTCIQNRIKELDVNLGNPTSAYSEIEKLIRNTEIEYEQKYLFQTDLYYQNAASLSYIWKKQLKKGISFLNKITLPNKNTHLEKFKTAFLDRFDTQEVSLAYALDTEVGIGYIQNLTSQSLHSYLDDLKIPSNAKQDLKIELDEIRAILNRKLQSAYLQKCFTIQLTDKDFEKFEENWTDLPDTLSFMAEIISGNREQQLFLGNCSGNAARLLARFCSDKADIQKLAKEITSKEQELNADCILAEILHLPESRIGNVVRRPILRPYEIPYLAKSILPKENQISVDDLYVSVKNNKLVLRSKKHNREVKPYLTNAHNYSANSLPLYHFLCDFGSQNLRPGLNFDWGGLAHIYDFLPRVEYENIILSKARWKIYSDEMKGFFLLLKNGETELLNERMEDFRNIRQIPQWIQLVYGDNTLVINLKNPEMLTMFLSSIKNKKEIIIEEFLCDEEENFVHQFIFPLYKNI